jgi:hypothetical protein
MNMLAFFSGVFCGVCAGWFILALMVAAGEERRKS